jgi:hypothetical protein
MVNYNIQQGGDGNQPWNLKDGWPQWPRDNGKGTEPKDIPTLAQRIIDGKVDIATLQEVFKDNAQMLEDELNKRAAPGEKWEVHFGRASTRGQWEDSGFPYGGQEDFGNAVVVRTGNGVTTGPTTVTELGPGDEPRSATRTQINVQ